MQTSKNGNAFTNNPIVKAIGLQRIVVVLPVNPAGCVQLRCHGAVQFVQLPVIAL